MPLSFSGVFALAVWTTESSFCEPVVDDGAAMIRSGSISGRRGARRRGVDNTKLCRKSGSLPSSELSPASNDKSFQLAAWHRNAGYIGHNHSTLCCPPAVSKFLSVQNGQRHCVGGPKMAFGGGTFLRMKTSVSGRYGGPPTAIMYARSKYLSSIAFK